MGKFCTKCGAPLAAQAKFCAACGQPAGTGCLPAETAAAGAAQPVKPMEGTTFQFSGIAFYYGLVAQRKTAITLAGSKLTIHQKIPILFFTGGEKEYVLDVGQILRVRNEKSLDKMVLFIMIGMGGLLLLGGVPKLSGAVLVLLYGLFKKELCFELKDGRVVRLKGVSGKNDLQSFLEALLVSNPAIQLKEDGSCG